MKKLSIAFICLFFALGTMADDLKKEKKSGDPITAQVDMNKNSGTGKMANAARIQKAFTFHDSCGQTITVYVSAPHGTFWADMGVVASQYVIDHLNSSGCYAP